MHFTPTFVALSLLAFVPAAFAQKACGDITIRTAAAKDCTAHGVAHFVNEDPSTTITSQKEAGKTKAGVDIKETCDHLVELQLVKAALELPGGACDKTKELSKDARKAALQPIIDLANGEDNLFFVSVNPENRKGDLVSAFVDPKQKAFNAKNKHAQVVAANSYLTQTQAQSTKFAARVDTLISTTFPGSTAPNVASQWTSFLAFAAKEAAKSQAVLDAPKKGQSSKTPANDPSCSTAIKRGGRFARAAAACARPKKAAPAKSAKKAPKKAATPKKVSSTKKVAASKKATTKKAAAPKKATAAKKAKGRV